MSIRVCVIVILYVFRMLVEVTVIMFILSIHSIATELCWCWIPEEFLQKCLTFFLMFTANNEWSLELEKNTHKKNFWRSWWCWCFFFVFAFIKLMFCVWKWELIHQVSSEPVGRQAKLKVMNSSLCLSVSLSFFHYSLSVPGWRNGGNSFILAGS